jgi:hypothetical protein
MIMSRYIIIYIEREVHIFFDTKENSSYSFSRINSNETVDSIPSCYILYKHTEHP